MSLRTHRQRATWSTSIPRLPTVILSPGVPVIHRDRWLLLAGGVVGMSIGGAMGAAAGDELFEWTETFTWPWSVLVMFSFAIPAWCLALFVLDLARLHLDFPHKLMSYGSDVIMPFYLLHRPMIIVLACYAVQWEAGILLKMAVVVFGSLLITVGLIEVLVRPFRPMRTLFGMKPRPSRALATPA